MFVIDDIINGVMGMANAGVSASLNYNTQKKLMNAQNAWSEKMNAQQQAWQEAMWDKNNLYNSAPEQMKRMMQAGINPNAAANAVAGVNASSQLAAQPSIPSSASGSLSAPLDLGSSIAQMMQAGMQREMNEKQKELMDSQIDDLDATAKLKDYQAQTEQERKDNVKANTAFQRAQTKFIKLRTKQTVAELKNTQLRNDYQEWVNNVLLPLQEATQSQQLENLKKDWEEATARIQSLRENVEVMKAQKADLLASVKVRNAQANLIEKQGEGQGISNDIARLDKEIKVAEKQTREVEAALVKKYYFNPATTAPANQLVFAIHRAFNLIGEIVSYPSRRFQSSTPYRGYYGDDIMWDSYGVNPTFGSGD